MKVKELRQIITATGHDLFEMFSAGTIWLERNASDIDALNVFPVPDGDCGKNMFLTMRAAIEEASRIPDKSAFAVSQALADGALLGARGNSGVILSQFLKGLSHGLIGRDSFTAKVLAATLKEASMTAYQAVYQAVEGTILTVMRDVAKAAVTASSKNSTDLRVMFEAMVGAAKESVARTPSLLPILREAGVVDAGGQGFYVLLEGALSYLKGEASGLPSREVEPKATALPPAHEVIESWSRTEEPYGYCTQFLIDGKGLKLDVIREKLEGKGKSLILVGNESNVRVHIHTFDPSSVLRYGLSLGTLHQISIESMDDQHRNFVRIKREKSPALDTAVVVVAMGEGMKNVFRSLGAMAVVSGGQTMNPSVRELVTAIESLPSEKILILPNNKNVIPTAAQVKQLTSKQVAVVPTKTMPQGIAALLAFSPEAEFEQNARNMEAATARVGTVAITQSVRDTTFQNLPIEEGQFIAVVDDEEIVAAGDGVGAVVFQALDKLVSTGTRLVTIYYGSTTQTNEVEKLSQELRSRYPGAQIELVDGGQPNYQLILSLE
jgi:DAK2 domain fusion protein YloV